MLRFDLVHKAGEGVGEPPSGAGVYPFPEAAVSTAFICPGGYVYWSVGLHRLGGEMQFLRECVAPLRGGTPSQLLG